MKQIALFKNLVALADRIGEITEARMYDTSIFITAVGTDGKTYDLSIVAQKKEKEDVESF